MTKLLLLGALGFLLLLVWPFRCMWCGQRHWFDSFGDTCEGDDENDN